MKAATIATGKAKVNALKYLSKNPSLKPVFTNVTTQLMIMLMPKDIIIRNIGWENFLGNMILFITKQIPNLYSVIGLIFIITGVLMVNLLSNK